MFKKLAKPILLYKKIVFTVALGGTLASCHHKPKVNEKGAPEKLENALTELIDVLTGVESDTKPFPYETLQSFLPEQLHKWQRKSIQGENTGTGGINISEAKAMYQQDSSLLEISILDLGSIRGVSILTSNDWTNKQMERSTDEEYEKSGHFNKFPCYEKENYLHHTTHFAILVHERAIVQLQSKNVPISELKQVCGLLKVDELEAMIVDKTSQDF